MFLDNDLAYGAAHVLSAAHRRLDLAVPVGAFGYLHFSAVIQFQGAVNQRSVALAAGGIDAHSTNLAFISCHWYSSIHVIG